MQKLECVAAFIGGEVLAVAEVEPETVDEHVPALFFVEVDDLMGLLPRHQLIVQTFVGQQPVEAPCGGLMGAGIVALYEEILAPAAPHLAGMQIVRHGSVVVAVAVAGVVVGELLIERRACHIPSVHIPSKSFQKGIVASHALGGWGVVAMFVAVGIGVAYIKQHTIRLRMLHECIHRLLQGVGCQVVVAVEKGCEGSLDKRDALIAGISLSVVLGECHHVDALWVLLLIAPQQGQRPIGGCIVDADDLHGANRLLEERIETSAQGVLRIVH